MPGSQQIYEGAFFSDSSANTLYSFAGFDDPSSTLNSQLSAFDITSNTWDSVNVAGGDFNRGLRGGALTATSADGKGFFTGGDDEIPGLIAFDSKTMSWKNETSENVVSSSFRGAMVSTHFGADGTLVVIGGYFKDTNILTITGPSFAMRDMSNIGVYDVASATWFNVTATGDIPANRANFCAAVSAAEDYSRYVEKNSIHNEYIANT